ncbi:MAG: trehalose-6-phosphate synthase [Sulfurovum sp.]|nr:trehalose-6-phosphate synthase [Sulfurovum sp.]
MSNQTEPGRLIVVSNRLPVVLQKRKKKPMEYTVKPASGGLVTAFVPVLKKRGGLWIGWPGTYFEEGVDLQKFLRENQPDPDYLLSPVEITLQEYEHYYKGFANEVLWPLFHNLTSYCNFFPEYYEAYKRVNQRFSQTLLEDLRENDFVWVQDYHLIPVAKYLREEKVGNSLGFFLHIPFPPAETFQRLPNRSEIIEALLAYDLVGFQTPGDRQNFLEVVGLLHAGVTISDETLQVASIRTKERIFRAGVFPISIDFDEFSEEAKVPDVTEWVKMIREEYRGKTLLLGIDRLDYTKGIPERLRAYRLLLEENPELHGKVVLFQVMVPSRGDIGKYANFKDEIERLIGEINGCFSRLGWVPIQYSYRSLSRKELLAYYQAAEIALVTPLKDGMNLVAKEYCVAHNDEEGVLILSEFAGSICQLKEQAILVNPFDENSIAQAIKKALDLDPNEKRERMRMLRENIRRFDIYWWVDTFLGQAVPTLRNGKDSDESGEGDKRLCAK